MYRYALASSPRTFPGGISGDVASGGAVCGGQCIHAVVISLLKGFEELESTVEPMKVLSGRSSEDVVVT